MASYEQAPNPQSYQFRPYDMPYNQIMQTVQAKTQYWLQGANQLKSAYQQAAGLDLSLDSNRSSLRDFTTQANTQINQAAKSDLSISDNVNDAMKIFEPLYDGTSELSQNILGDHALTTRAKQIQQQFEEAKTKNNGKEYSSVNEQYALSAYHDFVRNGDPKGWKDAYQNLKGYNPYYDYHKEISDNLKNCKPSTLSQTGINGMYITQSSTTALTSGQIAGCVGSSLSPQAEQQLQIEGNVRYGKNYQALADDYMPVALQNRQTLAAQRATLAGQLAGGKLTPEMTKSVMDQISSYDGQLQNIDDSLDRYHKGDLSFFKNNYDTLATATYRGQKLQAIGNAFQYQTQKDELKADPVQMMIANQNHQDKMLNQREQFDASKLTQEYQMKAQLEAAKKGMKLKINPDGTYTFVNDGPTPSPIYPAITGDQTKTGITEFNNDLNNTTKAQADNKEWLYNYLKSNPKYADHVPAKGTPAFDAYEESIFKNMDPNTVDLPMRQYLDKKNQLEWKKANLVSVKNAIESSPQAASARNGIKGVVDGVVGDEVVALHPPGGHIVASHVSKEAMKQMLTNGTYAGGTVTRESQMPEYGESGVVPEDEYVLHMPDGTQATLDPHSHAVTLLKQRDTRVKNYQSTIDNMYGQNYVSQNVREDLTPENDDNKSPNPVRRRIADALSPIIGHGDNSVNAIKDVELQNTDWTGNVRFSIKPDNKGALPDDKKVIQQLAAAGWSNVHQVPNTTGIYEISGVNEYNRSADVNTIHDVQQTAERLIQIHRSGGDKSPRIQLPQYKGVNLAAVTGPGGELYFELSDPKHPGVVQHATSSADLVYNLNRLTN